MAERVICELCGTKVAPHEHFIVRIDVFADPSLPSMTDDELAHSHLAEQVDDLLKQIETMSEQDLQDGVHRRFEYRLCPKCHKRFLANPLGKPRTITKPGKN